MVPTEAAQVEPEPMCGYRITSEVFAQVRQALDLHDLEATRSADSYVVSLAQANRALVPLMFDERSEWRVADGTPLESC